MKLPAEKFASQQSSGGGGTNAATTEVVETSSDVKRIVLNSSDDLFADLRDKNFNAVAPALSRRAKLLTSQFDVIITLGGL